MDYDFSQNNKYTPEFYPPQVADTYGVRKELNNYAKNEYLKKRDKNVLIGTDTNIPDEDPPTDELFLTNAVTGNVAQDSIDKTRYIKKAKSYVTINSAARNTGSSTAIEFGSSLVSSGGKYGTLFTFAPFRIIHETATGDIMIEITAGNNYMRFKLQDWTDPGNVIQVLPPSIDEYFDVFIPLLPNRQLYTVDQLQTAMETSTNIVASNGVPLNNSIDKNHMFTFDVSYNEFINPDRVTVQIGCQSNYKFTWDFYSSGELPEDPIARPLNSSDAAFVIQSPAMIFPFPNCYAVNLDRVYTWIKSVRVVSSKMPNTDTVINSYNNHITFELIDTTLPKPTPTNPYSQNIKTSSGSIDWEIYLNYGNYTLGQLVALMEVTINGVLYEQTGLLNVFTIIANEPTGIFTINVRSPYEFMWDFNADPDLKWRNLYVMLGFRDPSTTIYTKTFSNLISVNVGEAGQSRFIRKPYSAIMLKTSSMIWLQLNNFETIYDTLTDSHYFCQFNLDNVPSGSFAYDTFTPDIQIFVNAPKTYLGIIDVRIFDEVGKPYNFNGVDHSFTLEIVYYVDRLTGTEYNSRRGINDQSSYVKNGPTYVGGNLVPPKPPPIV